MDCGCGLEPINNVIHIHFCKRHSEAHVAALEAENAGLKRDMADIRRCALLPPSKPEILSYLASLRRIDAICEDAGVEPSLWDGDSEEYKQDRAHAISVMKMDAARRAALEAK